MMPGFAFLFAASIWGLKALGGDERWPRGFVAFQLGAHFLVVLTYGIGAVVGFANMAHHHKDLDKHAGFGAYCTVATIAWSWHMWYYRRMLLQTSEAGTGAGHKAVP